MTRALVADDERLMREQLCARLAQVWPELDIVAQARNGAEAVELTRLHRPDIVFLDIRMPGLNGVDAARQIAQLALEDEADHAAWAGCDIVFITAYDQYAVQAFEQGAVDYVLKPAEPERLALTAQRLQARIASRKVDQAPPATATPDLQRLLQTLSAQLNPQAPKNLEWIQATVGSTIQMIPVDDVLFFISDEKYTRVQTTQLQALIRTPIKELLETLDMRRFWQIHRGTLVNVHAIAGVSRDLRGRQLVAIKGSAEKLEVSRSFSGLFKGM